MITAEEFLIKRQKEIGYNPCIDLSRTKETLIEFAKLHVEAALKEVSEKVKIQEDYYSEDDFSLNELKELADKGYPRKDNYGEVYAVDIISIDKDSILNAYPLTNIK